jgi:glycosyltransferase involved in cell wall biosynthesis
MSDNAPAISVIVPARNCALQLRACLQALSASEGSAHEVIVVDDASTDDTCAVALRQGARVRRMDCQAGPATARNQGAAEARGEYLVFVDADVCVRPETLRQITARFHEDPAVDAVIGSYDTSPRAPNFVSQYRNLIHHYVHQVSQAEANTFWAGCGAIKRKVFLDSGGFDANLRRPCIEDIELGGRVRRRGHRIVLDKRIQVTHLKRWKLWNMIRTDVQDRAVPWTELILRERHLPSDLNLGRTQRLAALAAVALGVWLVVAACYWPWLLLLLLLVVCGLVGLDHWTNYKSVPATAQVLIFLAAGSAIALVTTRFQYAMLLPAAALAAVLLLNWHLYWFFIRVKGPFFALCVVPLHVLYYWYCVLGLLIGFGRHVSSRWLALRPSVARAASRAQDVQVYTTARESVVRGGGIDADARTL